MCFWYCRHVCCEYCEAASYIILGIGRLKRFFFMLPSCLRSIGCRFEGPGIKSGTASVCVCVRGCVGKSKYVADSAVLSFGCEVAGLPG